jgi:hypothetical protein
VTAAATKHAADVPSVSRNTASPQALKSVSKPLRVFGRRWARALAAADGRVIVNGSACDWDDINWVHHVQAVFAPQVTVGWARRLKHRAQRRADLAGERRIMPRTKLAITDTERMKRDLVERPGFPAERAHAVYLGIETRALPSAHRRRARRGPRPHRRWPHRFGRSAAAGRFRRRTGQRVAAEMDRRAACNGIHVARPDDDTRNVMSERCRPLP